MERFVIVLYAEAILNILSVQESLQRLLQLLATSDKTPQYVRPVSRYSSLSSWQTGPNLLRVDATAAGDTCGELIVIKMAA